MARTTGRSGFKMKSSPTKGKLGDFFSSLGKQLRSNKKGVDEIYAEKKSRKPGESKFQADVRRRQETNKAKRASWKADAEYYGSAEDKAKNSEANRIEPTVTEEPKSKGNYQALSATKPGDKFKYRANMDKKFVKNRYEFQYPEDHEQYKGPDHWETSKTIEGARAIRDFTTEEPVTPIQKRSKGFKMPGYGKRK
jgi:hypothetical protein